MVKSYFGQDQSKILHHYALVFFAKIIKNELSGRKHGNYFKTRFTQL